MIIKEYFGVEICYVQIDMPYLHLYVLNKLHKLGLKFRRFRASKNYNTMSILCDV